MPTDIDFNRIENNQKNIYSELDIVTQGVGNIKTADQTWAGLKTFNIISTPRLDDISGDITLGGIAASSLIKGRTYIIEGRSVVFSASAFNAARYSTTNFNKPDTIDVTVYGAVGYSGSVPTSYSGYNCRVYTRGGRGAALGDFVITNLTTGVVVTNITPIEVVDSFGGTARYYNGGPGVMQYVTSNKPDLAQNPPIINFRRCKYPIIEDEPIIAYDTNYNPAPSRKITLADIDAFRVG